MTQWPSPTPQSFFQCLKFALLTLVGPLRRLWLWVAITLILDQFASLFVHAFKTHTDDRVMLSYGVLYIAFRLLLASVTAIAVNQAYMDELKGEKSLLIECFLKFLKPMVIESSRVMASVSIGILLGVVPGIIRAVRLFWVLYIVQFDKEYDEGKVDALQRSRSLSMGRFWWSIALMMAWLITELGTDFMMSAINPYNQPGPFVFGLALTIVVSLYTSGVLFFGYLYLERNRKR